MTSSAEVVIVSQNNHRYVIMLLNLTESHCVANEINVKVDERIMTSLVLSIFLAELVTVLLITKSNIFNDESFSLMISPGS